MEDLFQNNDYQSVKEKAHFLRDAYIEDIEKNLLGFETQLSAHKINVRWVDNESVLSNMILDLLPSRSHNRVCFDMPYIPNLLQNCGNIIHNVSLADIENHNEEAENLIIQADFGVVENGSLVFVNKSSKNCFNAVNNVFVILNIDQLVVKEKDLLLFLTLQSHEEHLFPHDIKIISQPFKKIISNPFQTSTEASYSSEDVNIFVFLYDNGVSKIMEDSFLRQSLYCINCGKCLDVCPVAKAFDNNSPIDLIKQNCFDQFNRTQSLFQHTSLCGNCQDVCPVNIPLVDMLIYEMQMINELNSYSRNKQLHSIFMKRSKMNKYNGFFLRYYFIKRFFGKNRWLSNYFNNQKETFFNITRNTKNKTPDE